jgi:4-amino-4-deoxy-L-arabinose transferase-like glycosyltransferase
MTAESQSGAVIPSGRTDRIEHVMAGPEPRSVSVVSRIAGAVRCATVEQKFLAILLVLFLAKGVVITFVHPPFSGHDEVAHYAYLQFVAEGRRMPVIPEWEEWEATWNASGESVHDKLPKELWRYCRFTTKDWALNCELDGPPYAFHLGDRTGPMGWIYTANHPPLYYLIMTPVYWLTDGASPETQLYALRLAALPFGLLTVLFAYLTVRTLFPRDRFLSMMVPAFVAFQPQIAYEAAMLNNDIVAIAFTSAVIYLLTLGLKRRFPLRICLLIGFCFGLAMLAKNTAAITGAVIALAMILGLGVRNWRAWLPKGIVTAAVATLMVWPWFLYMYTTYGDFTALGRIRELQYWNYGGETPPTVWTQLTDREFVWDRWQETWGQFGWRLIPLSTDLARILLWVTMIGTVGIAVWALRFWEVQKPILHEDDPAAAAALRSRAESIFDLERWQVVGIVMMGITCIVSYYAILQFGTTFSLTQARYYFPAIVPAAILLMLGFRAMFPKSWLPYVQTVLFLAMIVLTLVIYSGYVIPYWESAGKFYRDIDPFYR